MKITVIFELSVIDLLGESLLASAPERILALARMDGLSVSTIILGTQAGQVGS